MTGNYTTDMVQDERIYDLESSSMSFAKADADAGQRILRVAFYHFNMSQPILFYNT